VIFLKDYPERSYFGGEFIPRDGMLRCDEETLIPLLESLNIKDIIPLEKKEHLAYYHYRKGSIDRYFFVNEGRTQSPFRSASMITGKPASMIRCQASF